MSSARTGDAGTGSGASSQVDGEPATSRSSGHRRAKSDSNVGTGTDRPRTLADLERRRIRDLADLMRTSSLVSSSISAGDPCAMDDVERRLGTHPAVLRTRSRSDAHIMRRLESLPEEMRAERQLLQELATRMRSSSIISSSTTESTDDSLVHDVVERSRRVQPKVPRDRPTNADISDDSDVDDDDDDGGGSGHARRPSLTSFLSRIDPRIAARARRSPTLRKLFWR
ncbi:unnamed protein product (mitochondrion) [Plasmodiophora brassicae]|uniref:Uncharacterized protein n=1 Tax=Plasmodiophora brassicae TaxID=37360 RepID=A0A3P3YMA6_PLABS|nr:unnamed protein product [Plasmodiophora brassicae]